MKSVIAVVFLFGLFPTVESQCNIGSCSVTSSQTCSTVTTYLDCLTQQLNGCGSDATTKQIIDTAVKNFEKVKTALCGGGSGGGGSGSGSGSGSGGGGGAIVTVSISTLVFCLLAFYLQL